MAGDLAGARNVPQHTVERRQHEVHRADAAIEGWSDPMSRSRSPLCRVKPVVMALLSIWTMGCGSNYDEKIAQHTEPIVYGTDDRLEYFESSPELQGLTERSIVALIPLNRLMRTPEGIELNAPSLGQSQNLCPGEEFADQPLAAFCSGVLVDWDLVLTAGHCVRLFALDAFAVVFDYYYAAPETLAVRASSIAKPSAIVAEKLDPSGADPRLDFAWIRLSEPVRPPREPAAVRLGMPSDGEAITSISATNGVPLKIDGGGVVRDARPSALDYFVVDTDTSGGSSGGGAFDAEHALTGVLARGADDWTETPSGCYVGSRASDGQPAAEQFTYVARAVDALCESDESASSLCRANCAERCTAEPPAVSEARAPISDGVGGCALKASPHRAGGYETALLAALLLCGLTRLEKRHSAKSAITGARDSPGCSNSRSR